MDALEIGNLDVMSRLPLINLVAGAAGGGPWVESGNVPGWVATKRSSQNHVGVVRDFGRNTRRPVDEGQQFHVLVEQSAGVLDEMLARGGAE